MVRKDKWIGGVWKDFLFFFSFNWKITLSESCEKEVGLNVLFEEMHI